MRTVTLLEREKRKDTTIKQMRTRKTAVVFVV
jgi:hypothetical protein